MNVGQVRNRPFEGEQGGRPLHFPHRSEPPRGPKAAAQHSPRFIGSSDRSSARVVNSVDAPLWDRRYNRAAEAALLAEGVAVLTVGEPSAGRLGRLSMPKMLCGSITIRR